MHLNPKKQFHMFRPPPRSYWTCGHLLFYQFTFSLCRGGWGPGADPTRITMRCLDKGSEYISGEGVKGASAGGRKMRIS